MDEQLGFTRKASSLLGSEIQDAGMAEKGRFHGFEQERESMPELKEGAASQ